ncbi:MAG: hypothetical protein Ct9H90mP17_2350 [Actinomycetota bacterium]|nr:MAG: hypothetical protein Ct9H90mP17_2350 [Actinomycetota bacterium]
MCQTYGNFLQKRSSNVSIKNQLELSKEDIERDEIVYERDNLNFMVQRLSYNLHMI